MAFGPETRCGKPGEEGGPVLRERRAGGSSETPKCGRARAHLRWGEPSTWEEEAGSRFHRPPERGLRGSKPREAPARSPANHRGGGDALSRRMKTQESSLSNAVAAPAAHGLAGERQVGPGHREVVRLSRTGEASKGEAQERSPSETGRGSTVEKESARRDEETLEAQRSGVR